MDQVSSEYQGNVVIQWTNLLKEQKKGYHLSHSINVIRADPMDQQKQAETYFGRNSDALKTGSMVVYGYSVKQVQQ